MNRAATIYPLLIPCEGDELIGIVHRSPQGGHRAVVIVVAGGPQYRVGAHRQFVSLARVLSAQGFTVLRFDLRGMGDSSGRYRGFEHSRADIQAAVGALISAEPGIAQVVLFGECESASGALFYGYRDPRVAGLILVNPWVHTEEVRAQVYVKHYYFQRFISRAFWEKVRAGQFNPMRSLGSMMQIFGKVLLGNLRELRGGIPADDDLDQLPLPARTAACFERFAGPKLLLLSGRDIIAREFDQVVSASTVWRRLLEAATVQRHDLPEANHTFSDPAVKRKVQMIVIDWLKNW